MKIFHDLTENGHYFMDMEFDQVQKKMAVHFRPGNPELRSSNLEANFRNLLKLKIDGKIYDAGSLPSDQEMTWTLDNVPPGNIEVLVRDISFGTYVSSPTKKPPSATEIADSEFRLEKSDRLSPFEIRILGRGIDSAISSQIPYDRSNVAKFTPKTDLHTHFAGNITVDSLIDIAGKNDTRYPVSLLRELGINPGAALMIDDPRDPEKKNPMVFVKDLGTEDVNKLKAAMAIPIEQQTTFTHMERIYRYRSPITKDITNFSDFLVAIANEYKKQGIQYAELSISDIVDPRYLEQAHKVLPEIERTTGVQLRFLVGLWRHSDEEWNLYEGQRIMLAAERSPYIVGVDWMGQETNSTHSLTGSFSQLAEWARVNHPNFIFRVHAGENPLQAENVGVAASLAEKYGVRLRIGHGLYGVDDDVMAQLKRIDAIVEFNMNSNMALNNLDSPGTIPIKRYIDHGIRVVLGQDGHGIYHTSGRSEVLAASLAGVTAAEFASIARTEYRHIHDQIDDFSRRADLPVAFRIPANDEYPSPAEAVRKAAEASAKAAQHLTDLKNHITECGIISDPAAIARDTEGKTPIWLGLASARSWPTISPDQQEEIIKAFKILVDCVDPKKAYFITGGEDIGSAKIFHGLAHAREPEGLVVLGATVAESNPDDFHAGTITHASIVARSWYDKAASVARLVKEGSGESIFFGGGAVVADEITTAHNARLGLHLMDGPSGASTQKARVFPDRSFKTANMLITRLYDANPNLFDRTKIQAALSGSIADSASALREYSIEEFGQLHNDGALGNGFTVSQIEGSPRPIFFLDYPMTLHAHDGKGQFDNTRQLTSGAIVVFGGASKIAPLVQTVTGLIESGQTATDEFASRFRELKEQLSRFSNFYEYGDLGASMDSKKAQLARATLGGVQALSDGKELPGNRVDGLNVIPEKWGSHFKELVEYFANESRFIEQTLPQTEKESIARSLLKQALGETQSYPRALPSGSPAHPAYRFDEPIKIGEYRVPAGSWAVIVQDENGKAVDIRPVTAVNNGKTYAVVSGDPYYVNGAASIGSGITPCTREDNGLRRETQRHYSA